MTKAEIIERIARGRVVEQLISNITHRSDAAMKDLAQIVYEALLNTSEERIIEIYNQGDTSVNCYCCAIICNQYYSDSSRFYYDFKKPLFNEEVKTAERDGHDGEGEGYI